jgi:hypothetical protein
MSETQEQKHTPGPCHVHGDEVRTEGGEIICDYGVSSFRSPEDWANAALSAEAFNVATETGRTPRQLSFELAAMTARAELAERGIKMLTSDLHFTAVSRDRYRAAKELAERQVAALAGTLASEINSYPCGSMAWSADQWEAWSRAEAMEQKEASHV